MGEQVAQPAPALVQEQPGQDGTGVGVEVFRAARPLPVLEEPGERGLHHVSNAWPYDTRGRYLSGPAVP